MKGKNLFKVLALAMAIALPAGMFAQETVGGGTDNASVASPYGRAASRTRHDADRLGPSSAKAANASRKAPGDVVTYGIIFGEYGSEIEITSENYQNITAANGFDPIKSGTVTFDPLSNTLTLKDAVIGAPLRFDKSKADIDAGTFIIRLEGANQITSNGASVAIANGDAVILGPGSLKTSAEKDCGIYLFGKNMILEIWDTGLIEAEGKWGISGPIGREGTLKLINANVKAKGKDGSICDLTSIEFTGCDIVSPAGATIENGTVMLGGSVCTDEVVIAPPAEDYGISIGGVAVTSANYQNITPAGGFPAVKGGQVIYDPATHTLALVNGTSVEASGEHGIQFRNSEQAYVLKLDGESKVTATGMQKCGLTTSARLRITGGKALFKADKECALEARDGAEMTIVECDIEAMGGAFGLCGDVKKEVLYAYNSNIRAQGSWYSLGYFKEISLSGCQLVEPMNGVILGGDVTVDGVITNQLVVIQTPGNAIADVEAEESGARSGIYSLSGVRMVSDKQALPKGIYIMNGKKIVKK